MGWRQTLVERAEEMAALADARKRAAEDGQLILVEGPAGIGKTRLLDALRQEATGFDVLIGRGGALERDIAFGVARQLFELRVARATPDEQAALLAGAAGPAAGVLGITTIESGPVPNELARSLHGLYWLVVNLADRQPLLLAVDDAQWADDASLEFLLYLARRLEGLPVLIALTARDGEPWSHEAARSELLARATVVRPTPLTAAGVGELLERAFGTVAPAELVDACWSATAGNPFYLGELLAAVAAPGRDPADVPVEAVRATVPSTVARSILLRLAALGEGATRLAEAAALLGDGASLRQAAALADLLDPAVEAAADALVRATILAEIQPVRFVHPIVMTAIAEQTPPARRATLHRQAAAFLRTEGAPLDRIVPHLLRAAPSGDPWVVEALHRGALEANARGVPELAVRCLRRALDEPAKMDLVRLLTDLGVAELAAGLYRESARSTERALDAASDPAQRAVIRRHQATALLSVEGAPAGLRCLERAIEEARLAADADLALLLEGEASFQAWLSSVPRHPVVARLGRHRNLPGETHGERYVLAVLAFEALRLGEPAPVARSLALRALAGGCLLAEQSSRTLAYFLATMALLGAEAYEDAHRAVDDGMDDCLRRGFAYGYGGICWMRGLLALNLGDLAAAEADERACVAHAVPTMVGIGVASLALVLLEQGDVTGAVGELERGGLLGDDRPLYVWGPYVRGRARLAQGRPEEALADLRDVGCHAEEVGGFPAALRWRAHAVLALDALGDADGARRMAAEELEAARHHGGPQALGGALRASGLVGRGEERVGCLAAAVEVLERSPARLDLAKARFDLGVALLRAGRRREGREALERSYDGARSCGARGLAEAVYEELLVAGARPRRPAFSGVDALTASERRVAEMAAGGITNRDIAQALFVTPKTVENQLGRVYGKLGVQSRRELRQALRRRR